MIPTNELRIGNWVYSNIYSKNMQLMHGDFNEWSGDVDPIPLTPEILEACGFKKICY